MNAYRFSIYICDFLTLQTNYGFKKMTATTSELQGRITKNVIFHVTLTCRARAYASSNSICLEFLTASIIAERTAVKDNTTQFGKKHNENYLRDVISSCRRCVVHGIDATISGDSRFKLIESLDCKTCFSGFEWGISSVSPMTRSEEV